MQEPMVTNRNTKDASWLVTREKMQNVLVDTNFMQIQANNENWIEDIENYIFLP